MSGSSRHVFFPPYGNTIPGYVFAGLPNIWKPWTNSHCKWIDWFSIAVSPTHHGLSELLYMSYAMCVSTLISSICQTELWVLLSVMDCTLTYIIKDLDGFMLLSKCGCTFSTFSDGDLDKIACFHSCIPNWAEHNLFLFSCLLDNLAHWWYQNTRYKLAFRHTPLLPAEDYKIGFLTKMQGICVLKCFGICFGIFFF